MAAQVLPLEHWANWMSLVGMAVLAVPALSLNKRKKALARVSRIVQQRERGRAASQSDLDDLARDLEDERRHHANRWRRADEVCLYVGYFLLLGTTALRL